MFRPKIVLLSVTSSTTLLIADGSKETVVEKVNNNCIWSTKGKTTPLECLLMLNYQLETMGDESVISIDHFDEFYVNLLLNRSICRLMSTHKVYGPYYFN